MAAKERKWVQGQRKNEKKKRQNEVGLMMGSNSNSNVKVKSSFRKGLLDLHDSPQSPWYPQRLSIPLQRTQGMERAEGQEDEAFVMAVEAAAGRPHPKETYEMERQQTFADEYKKASAGNSESRLDQFNDNLFEQTGENRSNERKLSTADEFKKNHMLKVSPLQQIKLSAKNLADMEDLNCNELIILSTNSDQRVHEQSY